MLLKLLRCKLRCNGSGTGRLTLSISQARPLPPKITKDLRPKLMARELTIVVQFPAIVYAEPSLDPLIVGVNPWLRRNVYCECSQLSTETNLIVFSIFRNRHTQKWLNQEWIPEFSKVQFYRILRRYTWSMQILLCSLKSEACIAMKWHLHRDTHATPSLPFLHF